MNYFLINLSNRRNLLPSEEQMKKLGSKLVWAHEYSMCISDSEDAFQDEVIQVRTEMSYSQVVDFLHDCEISFRSVTPVDGSSVTIRHMTREQELDREEERRTKQ
jgi:hypothetical protein